MPAAVWTAESSRNVSRFRVVGQLPSCQGVTSTESRPFSLLVPAPQLGHQNSRVNRKQSDSRAVVNIKPPRAKDMLRPNVPIASRRTEEERPGLRNSRRSSCLYIVVRRKTLKRLSLRLGSGDWPALVLFESLPHPSPPLLHVSCSFFESNQEPDIQIVRAATRTCSRNHACADSSFKRGCHVMKYGNGLISLGGSTKRTPSIRRTRFVSFRGTVRTRSVFATANIAAAKNGTLRTTRRFAPN